MAVLKRAALLIAENLASDAPDRRRDAHLFDLERQVLTEACAGEGIDLKAVRWTDRAALSGMDCALVLAVWDYQDNPQGFLDRIDGLEATGVAVFNAVDLVKWNIRKTYLRDLEARGAPVVPTLWVEAPVAADIASAFEAFGVDDVVIKRQVGAGARGQARYSRATAPQSGAVLDRAAMIQPFVSSVASEGEYSFVFVDGALSHALVKRAASGEYRIQPAYGGTSHAIDPVVADLAQAKAVIEALDEAPLYVRVDMVRGDDGRLMLMELEAIEPFLFPATGPKLGPMFAAALKRRLG